MLELTVTRRDALDPFALQDVLTALLSELFELGSEEDVYQRILHAALELVPGAQAGSITLRNDRDEFRFVAAVGFDLEPLRRVGFSYAETFFLFSAEARSFVIKDLNLLDSRMLDPERYEVMRSAGRVEAIKATLMAPIYIAGEVVASLLLDNFEDSEAFTGESRRTAEVFASLIGVALRQLRREQELSTLLTEFSRLFQNSFVATVVFDPASGRIIDCNESFLKLTDFCRHDVVQQSCEVLRNIVDEAWLDAALESLGSEQPGLRGEVTLATKTGQHLWCLAGAEAFESVDRRYGLLSFVDITERKQTEEDLSRAVQDVMQDTSWLSRALMARLAEVRSLRYGNQDAQTASLSAREREVLGLIARGHANHEIAAELGLAETTIRNYVAQVYQKLGVHSRAEAVVWARERGMIV